MADVTPSAPNPAHGFEWVAAPWGQQLVASVLRHFRHGWTTRQLPLRGLETIERKGWATLAEAAGVQPLAVLRLHQVHGAAVNRVSARDVGSPPHEADIICSDDPHVALAVQVADCVPILLADPRTGRVGAVHAGWRGTAANAAAAGASEFDRDNRGRRTVVAALGPSIGPCCYRVGPELRSSFEASGWSSPLLDRWFSVRAGALYLDLWRSNVDQLLAAGVVPQNVRVSRLCTACHPLWFHSYRRDGAGTGRMAGFIRSAKC